MANLFPAATIAAEVLADGPEASGASFGRSWRFDFDAGEFVLTPTGKIAGAAEDAEAWLEWCRKALATERYRHLVYSRLYGQEFESLIGLGLSRAAVESEIARIASETLLADPRTARVEGFTFAWQGDTCSFACSVTSVRDEAGTIEGSVVNL
ncbi:DUF2634 domain-containing protein [Cohnella sp. JJ-181]|uniref:DUF2634 domain-containing protein n=1 Tax=Cohnella rhizoplanae TaxID=2974897 RepID=UPI0022FFC224|nr:DUF2634 domain-containing protein [Cohnella sp. JJ-181]CAI6068948.1 hypothetical protein COHCIP112018_02200 [Cohnella sp. JJ-181]